MPTTLPNATDNKIEGIETHSGKISALHYVSVQESRNITSQKPRGADIVNIEYAKDVHMRKTLMKS
jgi:hypothetical protein